MVIVRFNHWEEFLAELKSNPPEDRTVRLTLSLRFDGNGIPHLTLVAGYLNAGTIVEFVQYLGHQPERQSRRACEIQALMEERKTFLEGLTLAVKSGRYHVPPTLQR
jgi:hypothetical protein